MSCLWAQKSPPSHLPVQSAIFLPSTGLGKPVFLPSKSDCRTGGLADCRIAGLADPACIFLASGAVFTVQTLFTKAPAHIQALNKQAHKALREEARKKYYAEVILPARNTNIVTRRLPRHVSPG
jgi:hypothetical protein